MLKKYGHSALAFILVLFFLIPVHLKVPRPMLLLERFFPGWGWLEIALLAFYSAFIVYKMTHIHDTAKWRIRIWTIFSFVFFAQLIIGLFGYELFLMTGKLHFPIPAMIIAGPVYRFQFGFMPILILTTIVLSGPAWCSQLCYFGALDALAAQSKRGKTIKNKKLIRTIILILVVLTALGLRLFQISELWVAITVTVFGIAGLVVILFMSVRKGMMVHCTTYCPIGVAVSYLKFINPFRVVITHDCTLCGICVKDCKYDALSVDILKSGKPGITCTYCGDCISGCPTGKIQYKLFNFSPETARNIWIITTVVIHSVFLGLARI